MFPHHLRELVRLRRRAHTELSANKPPDLLSLPVGIYLPSQRSLATGDSALGNDDPPSGDGQRELTGVGACGGNVFGPAKVLNDVGEVHRLATGDILVTRQTDPGWGPAFLLIRGLVLERGGMLSHGAILAREFGIPSVVGVRDASRVIRSGQSLHVDGDRGVVRLVDH